MTAKPLTLEPDPHNDELWKSYVDVLGHKVRPKDYVAYASINGKSPQLVVGRVEEIRRLDSKGEEIRTRYYGKSDPYCKVKVFPLIDARGFGRYGERKAVTLSIPENIVKIDWSPDQKTKAILDKFLEGG